MIPDEQYRFLSDFNGPAFATGFEPVGGASLTIHKPASGCLPGVVARRHRPAEAGVKHPSAEADQEQGLETPGNTAKAKNGYARRFDILTWVHDALCDFQIADLA